MKRKSYYSIVGKKVNDLELSELIEGINKNISVIVNSENLTLRNKARVVNKILYESLDNNYGF